MNFFKEDFTVDVGFQGRYKSTVALITFISKCIDIILNIFCQQYSFMLLVCLCVRVLYMTLIICKSFRIVALNTAHYRHQGIQNCRWQLSVNLKKENHCISKKVRKINIILIFGKLETKFK